MGRFNALCPFYPVVSAAPSDKTFYLGSGDTPYSAQPGFGYYPPDNSGSSFDLQELVFWFIRINTVDITGSITINTGGSTPDVYSGSISRIAQIKVGTFQGSTTYPSSEEEQYTLGPFYQEVWTTTLPQVSGPSVGTSLDCTSIFEVSCQTIVHDALNDPEDKKYFPTTIIQIGPVTVNYGTSVGPVSGFSVTWQGANHPIGKVYSRSFVTFNTDDSIGWTVSGSMAISPFSFNAFNDAEGNPLYNTIDGRQL